MHLGICNNTGLVYEGMGAADIPSIPTPNVTQAKLIVAEGNWQDLPAVCQPIRFAGFFERIHSIQ